MSSAQRQGSNPLWKHMTEEMLWGNRRMNWKVRKQVPKRFCTLETNPLLGKSKDKCSSWIRKTLSRKEKLCIVVITNFSPLFHFASSFGGKGVGENSLLDSNTSLQHKLQNIIYRGNLNLQKLKKNKRIFFVSKTLENCLHTECWNPTVFQAPSVHAHITELIFTESYFMVSSMC